MVRFMLVVYTTVCAAALREDATAFLYDIITTAPTDA
jgi:hypothetical protein